MKWLATTVSLLLASLALVSWIYFRDRNGSDWRAPDRQIALTDARLVASGLTGDRCASDCDVRLVGQPAPGRWLARVTVGGSARCFQIDLDAFSSSSEHGLLGVEPSGCTSS